MACDPHQLSVLSYANGFTLWHYRTNDSQSDIFVKDGYFAPVADMLRVNDAIILNAARGGNSMVFVTNALRGSK